MVCIDARQKSVSTGLNRQLLDPTKNDGLIFTSGFSGRLAIDNRKFRESSSFPNSLKVKRVGKFQ